MGCEQMTHNTPGYEDTYLIKIEGPCPYKLQPPKPYFTSWYNQLIISNQLIKPDENNYRGN
jgi:hypothetical protein